VILLGGTSCVGKSSLGQSLASSLGWDLLSTDQLARHPGRPWRDDGSAWLLGDEDFLIDRIRRESLYQERRDSERALIDTFSRRAVAFDRELRLPLRARGLQSFDVANGLSVEDIVETLRQCGWGV